MLEISSAGRFARAATRASLSKSPRRRQESTDDENGAVAAPGTGRGVGCWGRVRGTLMDPN